jgi:hypothetical protein
MPTLDPASIARRIAGDVWGHPVLSSASLSPACSPPRRPGTAGSSPSWRSPTCPNGPCRPPGSPGRLRQLKGIGEVWIAEEDCENKALLWSCPAVLDAAELVLLVDADYALEVAEDCCADFVAAYRALVR